MVAWIRVLHGECGLRIPFRTVPDFGIRECPMLPYLTVQSLVLLWNDHFAYGGKMIHQGNKKAARDGRLEGASLIYSRVRLAIQSSSLLLELTGMPL